MWPLVAGSFFLHLLAVDSLDVLILRNSSVFFFFKKTRNGWPLIDLGDSFYEHLDGKRSALMETLKWRLTEAACCHMSDASRSREWSFFSSTMPPFLTSIDRRVPLPRNWSTIFVIPGYAIDQSRIDVEEVDPHFVVAALICAPEAKRAVGIVKAPCIRICHSFSDPGGFMNPHKSAHSLGTSPGHHKVWGQVELVSSCWRRLPR